MTMFLMGPSQGIEPTFKLTARPPRLLHQPDSSFRKCQSKSTMRTFAQMYLSVEKYCVECKHQMVANRAGKPGQYVRHQKAEKQKAESGRQKCRIVKW